MHEADSLLHLSDQVRLPARSSIVSTTETSLKKNGDKLVYGPFKDVDPFSSKPLRLHYVDDRPYAHVSICIFFLLSKDSLKGG